jgi:CHAT domain-containing protein
MLRIYFLILLCLLIRSASKGQGVSDFLIVSNSMGTQKEETFRQFLNAAKEDGDSTKSIISRSLYGKFLTQQQRYGEAEKQLVHSLEMIEHLKSTINKSIPVANVSVYDTYDYLGELFTATANYKKAELFFKASERYRSEEFSRGSVYRIFNIQNLAQFYLDTEQNDLAEVYLNKLIHELTRTRFNSQKLKHAYAIYYKGMTEISIRLGRLEEAEKFLKKTFIFYGSPYSSYNGTVRRLEGANAETLLLRSRVLMMKGQTDEALRIIETAIGRAPDSLNFLPKLLRYKTICLFDQNNISGSVAVSEQLLKVNMRNLHKIYPSLTEKEKEEFNRRISFDFNLFNALIITGSGKQIVDQQMLRSLVDFRLQTKALLLNNSRKVRQAIFSSGDSSLIADFKLMSQLKKQASIEVFRKKSKEKMERVIEEIEKLDKRVGYRIASLHQAINAETTTADLQSRVTSNECAVEIIQTKAFGKVKNEKTVSFQFKDSAIYVAVFVFKDRLDYTIIHNGNELENRMVTFFKNSVNIVTTDSILYCAFWKPIAEKIPKTRSIYFSADGVYNIINLNLLHNAHGYLLDQTEIVLLSNLKDMTVERTRHTGKTATFIGRPQYELAVDNKKVLAEESVSRALKAASMEELKGEEFEDLPGTENEVVQGATILNEGGWTTEKLTGRDAEESRVKKLRNPTLLHLATHGFFIGESWGIDPMLRSGLIFSGVKNQEQINDEDGILTAYEASSLTLDSTKLVVLSACETGTGEIKSGEGVYGLQRAFMIAGAENIIMSLWKVDDTATQKLMSIFYKEFAASGNVRLSFTNAQRALRREYPEPRHWGAFVLLGR